MDGVAGIELMGGPVPVGLVLLACAAAAFLLLRRGRGWFRNVAAAAVSAWALALGVNWLLVHLAAVSAYDLPLPVIGWIAVAACGVLLMLLNQFSSRLRRKLLAPVAAAIIVLTAAVQVNAYFGQYRTIGEFIGGGAGGLTALTPAAAPTASGTGGLPPGHAPGPAVNGWSPPVGMAAGGTLHSAQIPGTVSGFQARTGYVYLPPAYQSPNHPLLPVLVLVAGQPGSPENWLGAGQLEATMDAFAAAHQGLSPVVVVPDVNGSATGNTMCMDSRIAKADTYLSVDVPAWIKATLGVDPSPRRWAIGGFSFGGTCALQMAALHPDVFRSAIDLCGEAEPALTADRAATVKAAFDGNTAAFEALTPLNVMAKNRYEDSWIFFAAGSQDTSFTGFMNRTSAAAGAAGMTVKTLAIPGAGHAWAVPLQSMAPALDWLGPRLGLSR
ncbi:alpha/beta hydrolase [Pseudarthrobacter sp. P1]|uniref:alpha/beta hydrolase n=1 Tax=Pseudarthrobacter sp. P1 TaxID=3418418 RepID=UPI003CF14763